MCGILGYSGNFEVSQLREGLRAMAHRGPDDSGLYTIEEIGVGLAHARLSILDLSVAGHQPMISADNSATVVFNGEIYNFRELRAELENRGIAFRGHSDTEVLLNLYLIEGEGFLTRLNGIFAFALWDARSRTMLIARDGLGVKPLYFSQGARGVAFASEIKSLLHLVPETREIDVDALRRYLTFLWCPGEGTPLKSVRKVQPGEALVVRAGKVERRWLWYRLPIFIRASADLDLTASLQGTLAHLRNSVRRQMVADVPVGAFLSGGLDSSAIVALAREQNPDIRCFTIEAAGGQEEGTIDDLPYARRVAHHLGVKLESVRIDARQMAGDLERMIFQLDEPLADPAPLNVLYISQLARQHGIKVLLSGSGGDDLFTGYRRHRGMVLQRYLNWLPGDIRNRLDQFSSSLDHRKAWARRFAKLFNGAGLNGDDRLINFFAWARESDLNTLLSADFRARLGEHTASEPMRQFLEAIPEAAVPLDRMLALEQRFFLADHNLIYTDKMSMAAGVEVRVPFLDLELVAFAQQVSLRYKQRGGTSKWILKRAMEPYLPRDVIYRPKSGFGAPLRRWLREDLRCLLGDLLSRESVRSRGLFEPLAVQNLISRNDSGEIDASYTLLSLLSIEIWCRNFIDRRVGSTV